MKRFSAQYVITNAGPPLVRAIITTDDDGTITEIKDTGGNLKETHSIEFYNGIIIPGFVNCHCHLELSHMKGSVGKGKGLGGFIEQIRSSRSDNDENIIFSATAADRDMYAEGVSVCADVCNNTSTFNIKKESRISYINLIEVFGIDPLKAEKRIDEITSVSEKSMEMGLAFSFVPHSVYSLSRQLFRLLRKMSEGNKITSVHFMESQGEATFLENHSGPIMSSYERSGLITSGLETVESHADAVLNEITRSGNLILVHNTFTDRKTVRAIKERENLFWCLCPNSNIYIENATPPLEMLLEEGCEIVIGTDSLASNNKLSILEELKTLQFNFPAVSIEELIRWATLNGARALGLTEKFGTIGTGKRPGLLLLNNVNLAGMRLLPESFVTRLI